MSCNVYCDLCATCSHTVVRLASPVSRPVGTGWDMSARTGRGPRGHSATRDGVGTARGTQVHNMLVEKLLEQKRDEIVSKWTL